MKKAKPAAKKATGKIKDLPAKKSPKGGTIKLSIGKGKSGGDFTIQ